MDLVGITPDALDAGRVTSLVAGPSGEHGAIVTFLGTVRGRNAGRQVRYLDYEAYEPLAERAFRAIADEIAAQWPASRVAIWHRTGRVGVGDTSLVIAAASPHRADAFAACRYAIERVKQVAPVWKREVFEDGEVWVEGATADLEDEAARQEAVRRACT